MVVVAAGAPSASATVLYATGFEPVIFSVGNLDTQDGWFTATGVSAAVQNFLTNGGTQAAIIASNVNGPEVTKLVPINSATNSSFLLQTDFYVSTQVVAPAIWSLVAANGFSQLMGGVNLNPDGSLEVLTAGVPAVASAFTRDAWHTLSMVFDFTTQSFLVGMDGNLLYSNAPFVNASTDYAGTVFFSKGSTSDALFLDNYQVAVSNPVPEPASMSLIGLGVLALLGKRISGRKSA